MQCITSDPMGPFLACCLGLPQRGHINVTRPTNVPVDWQNVLMNADNKRYLFTCLSMLAIKKVKEEKELYIMEDNRVKHNDGGATMSKYNREEADTPAC